MSDPMSPEVREWMKRTDAPPPDEDESARQVIARLPEVRQRRRWWPFPVLYRSAEPPTTGDASESMSRPVPAPNGHTPTVTGRTQSMFSPARAIAVGALVFAIGGVLLIAQPFGQQQAAVPGAAIDPITPATFTADAVLLGQYLGGAPEVIDGALYTHDEFQMAVDATDDRASGTLTYGLDRVDRLGATVHAGTVTLENDGGSWVGTFTGYWDADGARIFHARLTGRDAYEGGMMLLDEVCDAGPLGPCHPPVSVMSGVIVPGDLPAAE